MFFTYNLWLYRMALPRIPNYTIRTAYIPKNLFFGYKGKKKKNASEPPVVRASILTYNHHLWYALLKKPLIWGSYLDTDIIICYDNNLHVVLRER